MRGLLTVLGLIRPSGAIEVDAAKAEDEGCITFGSPYFLCTEKGLEGPYWPPLLGPMPDGYLLDPAAGSITYTQGAIEDMCWSIGSPSTPDEESGKLSKSP